MKTERVCCMCKEDVSQCNYFSFNGRNLWCLPCGMEYLMQEFPGYFDPAWRHSQSQMNELTVRTGTL